MKRQSLVLLVVAVVAAGAAGCFSDPVSSLRSGATLFSLDHQSVFLRTGDSVPVVAELKDKFGDALPANGSTWTSADPTIASVRLDTTVVPGNYFTRGIILGVSKTGGWTTVIVKNGALEDTVRVTVLPAGLVASTVSFSGSAKADTFEVPAQVGPPPVPAKFFAFTAPDTLIITGTSVLHFDTSAVTAYALSPAGNAPGFILAKTPTSLKVVFTVPAKGKVVVTHAVAVTGNPSVGDIAIDSLLTDTVSVSRIRFVGGVSQAGDTSTVNSSGPYDISGSTFRANGDSGVVFAQSASAASFLTESADTGTVTVYGAKMGGLTFDSLEVNGFFGTNAATFPASGVAQAGDTVTISAVGAAMTFDSTTGVSFGSNQAVIIGQTATSLRYVLSPVDYTGPVTVTNALIYAARLGSLPAAGPYTLHAFALPASDVSLGGGKLGDTVTITAPSGLAFSTTSPMSAVLLGNRAIDQSDTAWTLSVTSSTIKAFAKRGGTGAVTVTNVSLGTVVAPTLSTLGTSAIDSVASDFPLAATKATAKLTVIPVSNVDTVYGRVYCPDQQPTGACYGTTGVNDYWTFVTATSNILGINVAWFGSGNPYGSGNNTNVHTADLDGVLCDNTMKCDETDGADLLGYAAATQKQPEHGTTSAAEPAGQYWVGVIPFTGPYSVAYRLIITLQ